MTTIIYSILAHKHPETPAHIFAGEFPELQITLQYLNSTLHFAAFIDNCLTFIQYIINQHLLLILEKQNYEYLSQFHHIIVNRFSHIFL